MGKYVANRKDVCAGKLIKPISIAEVKSFDTNGRAINVEKMKEIGISVPDFSVAGVYRGMLFNVNENGLANDLIYTTPTNYPIDGIKPKVATESEFMISSYVELEELLKYLEYGVDLTQKDLNKIYKRLIANDRWLEHHMELFGWEKSNRGRDTVYTSSGEEATVPMHIYTNLNNISWLGNGKPSKEEPGYSLIKKRKNNSREG